MSTLMKKPLIEEICDSLGLKELQYFVSALDSKEGYEPYNLLEAKMPQSDALPLVKKATLAIQGPTLVGVYVKYQEKAKAEAVPKKRQSQASK